MHFVIYGKPFYFDHHLTVSHSRVAACWLASGSADKEDEDEEEGGFEGTPKPMLPYSSMFLFGPTNP